MISLRERLNNKFGDPADEDFEKNNMVVWKSKEEFPSLPFKKMYVNKYLLKFLRETFKLLEGYDLLDELKTFDGCRELRPVRGYKNLLSIHAWGLAIDLNASQNPMGWNREKCISMGLNPFSEKFVSTWREAGWICGVDFKRRDGMHFERTAEFGGEKSW